MTEKQEFSPNEIWGTLTESQRESCISLAVSHWQSGVDGGYLEAMGLDMEEVEELKKRGIIDARPGWEFAQEFLDQNAEGIAKVQSKLRDPLSHLSDEERSFLSTVSNRKSVAERKNPAIRYRLTDEKFHNFINTTFGDEK
jgi:hypothetical protein